MPQHQAVLNHSASLFRQTNPLVVEGEAGMRGIDSHGNGSLFEEGDLQRLQVAGRNVNPAVDEVLFGEVGFANAVDTQITPVITFQGNAMGLNVLVRSDRAKGSWVVRS